MRKLTLALGRLQGSPDGDVGSAGAKTVLDHLRFSLGSVRAAIVGWLRGGERPVASTLADHGRLLHQYDATHEHEHEYEPLEHEHGPRPVVHGGPPSPTRKSSEEALAALVDRSARAIWAVWVAGTREPTWDELPERVRERVRASARAGLAAAGLSSPTELEDWLRERQGRTEEPMRAAGQERSPDR
jgi:hypothetical protein